MMTEEEARNKMCPYVAIVSALSVGVAKEHGIRCLASECMMWEAGQGEYDFDAGVEIPCGECGLKK